MTQRLFQYASIEVATALPKRCGTKALQNQPALNLGNVSIELLSLPICLSLSLWPPGSWHNVTSKQLFTATVGNSFKCLSKQMVNLADNFQLLTVNTQLQAFAIVGNQFGKGMLES